MSRKIFTFFKQCLQKYSLREYKNKALIFSAFFCFATLVQKQLDYMMAAFTSE